MSPESKVEDRGEFYLEPNEWGEICQTNVNSKNILDSNWTNKFAEKFSEVNAMCVLEFNHYWLKKTNSRKKRSPFFRADAECSLIIVEPTNFI